MTTNTSSGKTTTTLNIRGIDASAAAAAKIAAAARGMTLGQYVAALVTLHQRARTLADADGGALAEALDALALGTRRL